MHKTTGYVLDPLRFVIRIQKSVFCMQKPQMRAGPMETSNSDAKHAVLHAENHRWGLGPMDTCYSDP